MKKGKKYKSLKLKITIVLSILLVICICFSLAYRYLIERVEMKVDTNNYITVSNTSTVDSSTQSEPVINEGENSWRYSDEAASISINKVQQGEGDDKVTYFVADIKVNDAASLKSAFAKDEFGRNIVEKTSDIANNNGAIFAINGDYYGFRGDGVEIRNGILYRDVPARVGAAIYSDGTLKTYNENDLSSDELLKSGVLNTMSFGPTLIENGEIATNISNVKIDSNFGNSSIQNANPRTGIGMVGPNHFIIIVVDGRSENYSRGLTLEEFAKLFSDYGCEEAYNLDGGGSSTMYFNGKVINRPSENGEERRISDIFYISGKE